MAKERGWWDLKVDVELDDVDREHIAEAINSAAWCVRIAWRI